MKILVIGPGGSRRSKVMKLDGHYDANADIASLRFARYDPATALPEMTDYGFRELDIARGEVVGLQYWQASRNLPADLLAMLPAPESPPVDVDATATHSRFAEQRT
ncbi:MAG: hypothetical protein ACJ76X_19105 [Solirubrobacteraceae bacterium]|jgi:uncharacterized protein YuzE